METLEDLDAFRRWLSERRPVLALDIETTGLSLAKDRTRLVQFGDAKQGWALPYADWRGAVKQVVETYEGKFVLQHAKFDAGFLMKDGIRFPWSRTHDTMFMAFLNNSMGPKSLKQAAAVYVDAAATAGEASLRRAMIKNRWTYETVPITHPAYWGYAALDTVLTARLAEVLWPLVQPFREAYDLEVACERVLCEMELRGVRIDVEYCNEQFARLQERLIEIEKKLDGTNPFSTSQVIGALQRAGATWSKRTESGQLSVDDEVLSALAAEGYEIAQLVRDSRWANKMLGTYFENFLSYHNDGILNPHINQVAARTGRMSITEPALQTVPKTSLVRDAFVAAPGHRLLLCDYDNEELRVAAHFTGDENMLIAFRDDRSLHDELAEKLFGSDYTKAQRKTAKACMFAKAYGAGITKFAWSSGLPLDEATRVFRGIDELYPGLGRTMMLVSRQVQERAAANPFGWVKLIDGRHLMVKADKAYVGFNALIQGSCAVVLKQTLVDLDLAGFGEMLRLPIHDEVMFEIPTEDVVPDIQKIMTRTEFRVPLTVGTKVVRRWGDAYSKDGGG